MSTNQIPLVYTKNMKYIVASFMVMCFTLAAFNPAIAFGRRVNAAPVLQDASNTQVFTSAPHTDSTYIITVVLLIAMALVSAGVGYWMGYRRRDSMEYRLLQELREQCLEDNRKS